MSQIEVLVERELFSQNETASDGVDEALVESIFLDGNPLGELTNEDKAFLERFTNLKQISLSQTNLSSLKNLP